MKKYYPKTLLGECKYETKKTKMENLINDELQPSSSDDETDELEPSSSDDETDSETESDNESNNRSDNEFDNESDNE